MPDAEAKIARLRARLHQVIFEADTPAGRAFDLLLLLAIVTSVIVVMLESVASVRAHAGPALRALEWGFTILFTIEYALRLFTVQRPLRYAMSVFGLIDLFAILPTYLSLVFPGAQSFLVIRLLRMLRIFRILKHGEYLLESRTLAQALRASRRNCRDQGRFAGIRKPDQPDVRQQLQFEPELVLFAFRAAFEVGRGAVRRRRKLTVPSAAFAASRGRD